MRYSNPLLHCCRFVLFSLCLALLSVSALAQTYVNTPLSRTSPGLAGNASSGAPHISPQGRHVAFNSGANDLVSGVVDPEETDVFLYDRQTGTMTLVSHGADDPLRSSAPGFSQVKGIASFGVVLFDSTAPHLLPGQTASYFTSVYLHEPFTGNNRLISHAAGAPGTRSNGECTGKVVDASGQYAIIACLSSNVQAGITDSNGREDLYLYSTNAGSGTLINHSAASATTTDNAGVDGFNGRVAMTANGDWIAFASRATNLVTGQVDTNNADDVFLFDKQTGTIRLVSHIAGNTATAGTGGATLVGLSTSHVIFNSSNNNMVSGGTDTNGASDVFSYHIATGTVTFVTHASGSPLIAANGASVAAPGASTDRVLIDTTASNLNNTFSGPLSQDVVLWTRSIDSFQLVSRSTGGPTVRANASAFAAASNVSTTRVVFESAATNLVPGYAASLTNATNLYFFDPISATTTLVTHDRTTSNLGSRRAADRNSVRLDWSAEHLVLASPAGDLSASADGNAVPDVYVWTAANNAATLISRSTVANATSADRQTSAIDLSANGRYLVQNSEATDLVFDQTETGFDSDVFVVDTETGAQSLLSYAIQGFDVLTNVPANAPSTAKAISRDGNWVLMSSAATNLIGFPNDTNAAADVFLVNRTGGSILVSHASTGNNVAGNGAATPIAVSGNGQYVLYESNATNAVTGFTDTNGSSDVFLFDRLEGTSVVVSRAVGANSTANDVSRAEAMTPDGRFVLYRSRATNLINGFVNLNGVGDDAFLYDRQTNSSRLVSREFGSAVRGANAGATAVGLSDNGDLVVFDSSAGNLIGTGVSSGQNQAFVFQVSTGVMRLVSHSPSSETDIPNGSSRPLAISGDGAWILVSSTSTGLIGGFVDGNAAGTPDLFWYNTASRVNSLFSRANGSPTQSSGFVWSEVRMNPDASRTAFSTAASDVIAGVNPGSFFAQIYVFDRATDRMSLVSHRTGSNAVGIRASSRPLLDSAGDRVAFSSDATDLANWNDTNAAGDTFIGTRITEVVITPVVTGNGTINPAGAQTVDPGETVVFTLTPGQGQRILSASGCGGALAGNQYTTAPATADCTVTITFAPQQFTLTYLAGPNGQIQGNAVQTVDYNGSGTQVAAVPSNGYQFDRWSDGFPAATRVDSAVQADRTITAFFVIKRYNLLYSAGAGGTIDGQATVLATVDHGADGPTVHAIPNSGQAFVRWSDGLTSAARTDLDVVAHLTVNAEFASLGLLTVTPVIGPNGSATPASAQSVAPGATTFFDLSPNAGHRIGQVSGCGGTLSGNRFTTGPIQQDCNVNITFNRLPVAMNGSLEAIEDGGTYGGVLGVNDDDPITATVLGQPTKGNLIVQPSLQFFYTPNPDANGSDSFTFRINDGVSNSNVATVSIDIVAVNDRPTFTLNPAIIPEHPAGTSGPQTRGGLLANVDFGPPDEEATQTLSSVFAMEIFDPAQILSGVNVSTTGQLTYTLSGGAGLARVMVSITDSGGTSNGGTASSDTQQLTLSVQNGTDVQVSNSNGANTVNPGQNLVYEVLVANAGPYATVGARLDVPVPAGLGNVLWSCTSIQFASCPQLNGAGPISNLGVDLAVNGALQFLISGTVTANVGETLQHQASIDVAAPMIDTQTTNNSTVDADAVLPAGIGLFRDGFEASATITVPIPEGSTLYPLRSRPGG